MSLDVWLHLDGHPAKPLQVWIREDGRNRAITMEEWNERFPDQVSYVIDSEGSEASTVFEYNITHNLGRMANEAGIYEALWRPEVSGISKAAQLIEPLRAGLEQLRGNPDHFRQFNPANGWGKYENLVEFVAAYLAACEQWPDADVRVSR